MRWTAAALALVVLAAATPAVGTFHEQLGTVPDRQFLLVMSGTSFNGLRAPEAPLLEAYLGERVRFTVLATEAHTFHLHGHPWLLADGSIVDTFLVDVDRPHAFDVPAGGVDGHAGDWMYHCHVDSHVSAGMWGIFRVHPFKVELLSVGPETQVLLTRLGAPVDGARLALSVDGEELPAHVVAQGGGRYLVHAALPPEGQLVVAAEHAEHGTSLARAGLGGAAVTPVALATDHRGH